MADDLALWAVDPFEVTIEGRRYRAVKPSARNAPRYWRLLRIMGSVAGDGGDGLSWLDRLNANFEELAEAVAALLEGAAVDDIADADAADVIVAARALVDQGWRFFDRRMIPALARAGTQAGPTFSHGLPDGDTPSVK